MPIRHAHREIPSPAAGYGSRRSQKEPQFEVKKPSSRSVKKLVRSLSDRYTAVTSPLTCKRTTSCSSRTPSLKTMKTTTATSLLPLKPGLSVSCRPAMQSTSRLKESFSSSAAAARVQSTTPSIAMSKRLLHMQALACTEIPVRSVARSHGVVNRPQRNGAEQKKIILRASPPAIDLFRLETDSCKGDKKAYGLTENQLTEMGLRKALLLESNVSRQRETCQALETLSSNFKNQNLKWEQLEALLKHKDDELDSLQTAGLMLKELCMKQDDEIKTLKAAFPATLREVAQLREACQKQEKELAYSRVALPALQAQVTALSEQLKSLMEDLTQMKGLKEASSEKVSSHFHDREASNSGSSCLSMEASPTTDGFLEHLTQSRREPTPCEDQGPMPVRVCEAMSSCCSSVTSIEHSSEKSSTAKHRRGFSAVLSVEHMLRGSGKRSGRRLLTDKDIVDTLQELDNAADKEQALLQARCANAVKELRSSSSRLASLEPIKSILTCASPQLFGDSPENESSVCQTQETSQVLRGNMWNLKPT